MADKSDPYALDRFIQAKHRVLRLLWPKSPAPASDHIGCGTSSRNLLDSDSAQYRNATQSGVRRKPEHT
ncbi:hypothetical protein SAMN05216333_1345 [Nitrosomonas oligotropha]|uniref:Uncharacterized protein n=1 Tax=Nitrosomonas oligotropha TaxID=42354 RepID=A0A1H8UF05_9PROT|nr:hypothetical protein SAMN05216300_1375 [Nitrosomonas oligotropha]SEP01473.1 hypothetical protein SAMN05216333_1345 [Nitrosomonas oligotropha]